MVTIRPAAFAIFRRGMLAFLFIRLLAGVVPVWGATFNVDRTDDDATATACVDATPNDCSIRGAIITANALPGADSINVPAGIYALSIPGTGEDAAATGDLDITDDLSITGADRASTIIDGGGLDRVLHIHFGNVVAISGVTIKHGNVNSDGGGIWNAGTLTLTDSTVTMNTAISGGGIHIRTGTATVVASTVSSNTATRSSTGGGGGGVHIGSGTLELTGSTVTMNTANGQNGQGGGIYNHAGVVMLIDSTVSNNAATFWVGGGIHSFAGPVTITSSTVSDNTAGAHGGGIVNSNDNLTLTNSTVSGNTATCSVCLGGGILNGGNITSLTLTNSTVVGNLAGGNGGGIHNVVGGDFTLKNTIVANNTSGGDCAGGSSSSDITSPGATSFGHNLDSDGTCELSGPGDISGVDPLLGPLQDNGGPTLTHVLLSGSPAIDAVPVADCTDPDGNTLTTDQRGVARPPGGDFVFWGTETLGLARGPFFQIYGLDLSFQVGRSVLNPDFTDFQLIHADGDALCDIGAYEFRRILVCGSETSGSARGPAFQLYERDGTLLVGPFVLNPNFTQLKCNKIDTDGDGTYEIMVSGQETTGLARGWAVQVYDQSGQILWGRFVVNSDTTNVLIKTPR